MAALTAQHVNVEAPDFETSSLRRLSGTLQYLPHHAAGGRVLFF